MTNINILSYINTNNETKQTQKSYTDKPSGFNDIFDNVNKLYTNEASKSGQYSQDKLFSMKTESNFNKEINNKIEDREKIKEKEPVDKQEELKTKTEETEESEESSQSKKDEEKENNKDKDQENGKKEEEKTTIIEKATEIVQNVLEEAIKTGNAIGEALAALTAAEKPVEIKNQAKTEEIAKVETVQKEARAEIEVDLAQIAKTTKDTENKIQTQTEKVKVQPQTQQVLLNLQVEPGEKHAQATTVVQDNAEAKVKTPQILASAEAVANIGASSNTTKEALKDFMKKNILTQDILDQTNATVVKVETTSSTNSSLLNQQNAQEQGVKLAFESTNNMATMTTGTTQTSFDKTLDNVHQPKELNKTDILSQINTKMEDLKETGTTKVTIVLKPENLGKINLELINSKEGMTARMTTDSPQVKELLDKNLESLRNTLGTQGVNVNTVVIKVEGTQQTPNEMFSFEQNQQNNGTENQSSFGEEESSHERNYQSKEEFSNKAETEMREEQAQTASHDGQVDYKI